VHLLYDLDLRDPQLGLASRFPGLARLPLYNALQYNCCAMVYRVVADVTIRILDVETLAWDPDHPYENYPPSFKRVRVIAQPVSGSVAKRLSRLIDADGGTTLDVRLKLDSGRHVLTRVGGRHFLWQGVPHWECPTRGCRYHGRHGSDGAEVFAVIWESPIRGLHIWSDDPKDLKHLGCAQIIYSRCIGCGVIHSCNRCD
jgi:hypothetical protein